MFQRLVTFYKCSLFIFSKGWTEEDSQWMTQINRLQKLIDRLEKKVCVSFQLFILSLSVKQSLNHKCFQHPSHSLSNQRVKIQHPLRALTVIKCLHTPFTFFFPISWEDDMVFPCSPFPFPSPQIQLFIKNWKVTLLYDRRMLLYLVMFVLGNMGQGSLFRIWFFSLPLQTFPLKLDRKFCFFCPHQRILIYKDLNTFLISTVQPKAHANPTWEPWEPSQLQGCTSPQSPETSCSSHTKAQPSGSLTNDPPDPTTPRLPRACKNWSYICLYRKCIFLLFSFGFIATLGFKSCFMSVYGELFFFLRRRAEEKVSL